MMNQSSLVVDMEEVVTVMINKGSVRVQDTTGSIIDSQISPSYNSTVQASLDLGVFDLVFVATIPALSMSKLSAVSQPIQPRLPIHHRGGAAGAPHVHPPFDPMTKLLRNATNKLSGHIVPLDIEFTAYPSTPFRTGAYLFSVVESSLVEPGADLCPAYVGPALWRRGRCQGAGVLESRATTQALVIC